MVLNAASAGSSSALFLYYTPTPAPEVITTRHPDTRKKADAGHTTKVDAPVARTVFSKKLLETPPRKPQNITYIRITPENGPDTHPVPGTKPDPVRTRTVMLSRAYVTAPPSPPTKPNPTKPALIKLPQTIPLPETKPASNLRPRHPYRTDQYGPDTPAGWKTQTYGPLYHKVAFATFKAPLTKAPKTSDIPPRPTSKPDAVKPEKVGFTIVPPRKINLKDIHGPFRPAGAQTAPNGIQRQQKKADPRIQKTSFPVEDQSLSVDTVLVPQERMVISSTRDGKIGSILARNGDSFEKGDVLLEYRCADVHAEKKALEDEQELAQTKLEAGSKLFKLDMISRSEQLELKAKHSQVEARQAKIDARMERCKIRAPFDGRVVERLANEGEYTRTDRVLMEIVSGANINAELLLPSIWLRWVNVGSPLTIYIEENDTQYQAYISRIHGRIDPASKTIQVVARLEKTNDRLLPGMSGQALLNTDDIKASGIPGYLTLPDGGTEGPDK